MKKLAGILLGIITFVLGCHPVSFDHDPGYEEECAYMQELLARKEYDSIYIVADRLLKAVTPDTLSVWAYNAYSSKGVALDITGKYDQAGYNLYCALRAAEAIDDPVLQGKAHNNIGILYFNQRDADQAIGHYHKFYEIAAVRGDSISMVRALNNMGNACATIKKDLDGALSYFETGLAIADRIGYWEGRQTIRITMADICIGKGNLEKALQLLDEVKAIDGWDYYADYALATIYNKQKQYDKAISLYQSILARKVNNREFYLAVLNDASEISERNGDLKSALRYRVRYQADRDSMHTLESARIIQNLKIAYETEKKEMQIVSVEEEKRLILWLTLSCIALLALFLVLLVFRQRFINQKKELAEKRVEQLEQEKELVAAKSLLDGENQERGRLSRELHDGLGGLLTMAKLDLDKFRQEKETEKERLEHVISLMDRSITEMRRLAHNLMPESLARFGLYPVLEEFCAGSSSVDFYFYGKERRLDRDIEINIYRIACELINNALKHAEASQINVQLIQADDSLSLTVQDDGRGMGGSTEGQGLSTVRSRIELLGATLNIVSGKERGTEITVELNC
ncbi:tetratricopeptide repeat-containing sensor histidine kinase [Parabacteroides chinchillae]|uniref:histidine kinase n=1 Tax=Parabacteroides chinchillae TaxID=871327 RepID=A0A8G2BYC8_9BACT|nr:sensor histidine kinase [Parabacteroides chinchillae]SEG17838.1 Signal transduction histidine kinase [Parabacteroides chinchillae]